MEPIFFDSALTPVWEKVKSGQRLSAEDGVLLYNTHDLNGVGQMANHIRIKRHGRSAFYVYNQHVNYSNICKNRCRFCAYAKDAGDDGAYTYTHEDVAERLLSRIDEPIREIHMVGGLNPELDFDYFLGLIKTIKTVRPGATVKAFTAVEIDYLAELYGESISSVVSRLKDAGLEMMPGGGAEVLSTRVHEKLFPKKIGKDRWLEVIEEVHKAGIVSNATMLYGHIETIEERVDHLVSLRSLQDRTGGFSAFIPLAFHSKNTELTEISSTSAFDDLKNVSVARLMLDNFDHIKAYWVMIGEKLAQVALSFGADDLDGTIIEEKITHTAGATSAVGLTAASMQNMIRSAGFEPVERDSFYRAVGKGE